MPEVFHDSPQEFWRPPAVQPEGDGSTPIATCQHCGSEFITGSHFCHTCGAARSIEVASPVDTGWSGVLGWLKFLEFHRVQGWFGLSTISLAAFLIGIGCMLGAITVGLIYSAQTLADFQAIQLWRIEWLLAAVAAFAAGILLKKSGSAEK